MLIRTLKKDTLLFRDYRQSMTKRERYLQKENVHDFKTILRAIEFSELRIRAVDLEGYYYGSQEINEEFIIKNKIVAYKMMVSFTRRSY